MVRRKDGVAWERTGNVVNLDPIFETCFFDDSEEALVRRFRGREVLPTLDDQQGHIR